MVLPDTVCFPGHDLVGRGGLPAIADTVPMFRWQLRLPFRDKEVSSGARQTTSLWRGQPELPVRDRDFPKLST